MLTCTWAEIFFSYLGKVQRLIIDEFTLAFQPGWDWQFFPHALASKVFLLLGRGEIVLYGNELIFASLEGVCLFACNIFWTHG